MKTERVEMRVTPQWLAAVDEWRKAQLAIPSRTEAIRALVELGLEAARRNTRHPAFSHRDDTSVGQDEQ